MIAILLPSLGALILAWVGYYNFEKTMANIAGSYVQNLTRATAARVESHVWNLTPEGTWKSTEEKDITHYYGNLIDDGAKPLLSKKKFSGIDVLDSDNFDLPGSFAIYSQAGNLLYGTDDFNNVPFYWYTNIRDTKPRHINIPDKGRYTIATYPVIGKNLFVVGAVSWHKLLGAFVPFSILWPLSVGLLGLLGLLSVYVMWKRVLMPLKYIETEISLMNWGEEIPSDTAPESVQELQSLKKTLALMAQSAVEKNELSQRYMNDVIATEEEERERISREIHDGPVQDITALIQRLRLVLAEEGLSEPVVRSINYATNVALACVREMREFCNNLTPPWLDLGITQALTELADRQSKQLDIKIFTELEEAGELPGEVVKAFFRITQEAINNAAHHAEATMIFVTLSVKEEAVELEITDNGSGFEVPKDFTVIRTKGHRGLSNMMERMSLVHGTFEITSSPEGTTVHCVYPLEK